MDMDEEEQSIGPTMHAEPPSSSYLRTMTTKHTQNLSITSSSMKGARGKHNSSSVASAAVLRAPVLAGSRVAKTEGLGELR
jgi:hypothetical protein